VDAGPASYAWLDDLFEILADRMLGGVDVRIVLPNYNAYAYGWTTEVALNKIVAKIKTSLVRRIKSAMLADGKTRAYDSVADFVCQELSLATLRMNSTAEAWSAGPARKFGNHGKLFMIDDEAFYIGSQNLYISNLFEWGLLVDGPTLTAQIKSDYWDDLWLYAERTAVSGPGVKTCEIAP
jgi:phosphatidylserine/phosphatidylglycerophosphate/cardiolipin synthase-like enzyme